MSGVSKIAAIGFLLFAGAEIVLYGCLTQYEQPTNELGAQIFFPDVHVMIFIGFGFLMSFLSKAGFTATGHAFFVAAYTVLWGILNRAFWKRAVLPSQPWVSAQLNVADLTNGDFVAGAVLISFGAVLGRVSLTQLTLMAIIEVVCYAMNEASILYGLQITDSGGTYFIHMFGAYFGLVASAVLEKMSPRRAEIPTNASTPITDTLSMVGTLFLFIYFPSWNAAAYASTLSHNRAMVNTFLSIVMSTISAFLTSILLDKNGKINMAEVQRATLSGGVAMGAAAGMVINPHGALVTGLIAGIVSVVGFRLITPVLNAVVPDTCGVHNLHGLPSIIGAIVSAIALGSARIGSYQGTYTDVVHNTGTSYERTGGYQIVAIGVTLGFAIVGGVIAGVVMGLVGTLPTYYDDEHEYNVVGAEGHHAIENAEGKELKEVTTGHNEPAQ